MLGNILSENERMNSLLQEMLKQKCDDQKYYRSTFQWIEVWTGRPKSSLPSLPFTEAV